MLALLLLRLLHLLQLLQQRLFELRHLVLSEILRCHFSRDRRKIVSGFIEFSALHEEKQKKTEIASGLCGL